MRIPVISLSNPCLDAIRKQAAEMGVFYVKTGMPKADTNKLFQSANRLFSVPMSIKDNLVVSRGGFMRGYIGYGKESGSDLFESKEAFSYGYPWPKNIQPLNSLQGENIWPPESSMFSKSDQKLFLDFFMYVNKTSLAITKILSLALNGNTSLVDHCKEGDTISLMRVFNYPGSEKSLTGSVSYHILINLC